MDDIIIKSAMKYYKSGGAELFYVPTCQSRNPRVSKSVPLFFSSAEIRHLGSAAHPWLNVFLMHSDSLQNVNLPGIR